jgi:hypothetical protein
VKVLKVPDKSEVFRTSNTVSKLPSYSKGFISYKHRADVTKMSHDDSASGVEPDPPDCVVQIDRLVKSPLLQGSEALCKLLQYLAHHTLNSPADHLKEYQIGTEVLGRPADFDPQTDSSVRMQVGRLRTKLNEYYNSSGAGDPILVDVPKGRYALSFERRALTPRQEGAGEGVATRPLGTAFIRRWQIIAGVIVAALAIACCAALWFQNRAMHRSMDSTQRSFYPWQYEPSVAGFWSDVLNASPNTDIVLADTSYGLLQATTGDSFGLNDYMNRSYVSRIQAQKMRPEMHDALNRIAAWRLGSFDEFKLARGILALDPLGQKMHLYSARDFMPDLIKRDNVILIGGRLTNPWEELFESELNFTLKFDNTDPPSIVNKAPVAGERGRYIGKWPDDGYCVVAYLPNSEHNGVVIMLEGTDAEASEAAGDFLLSESQLSDFRKLLRVNKWPYFEVLLKVSEVRGTPLTATVEAYRTYPNLH